MAFPPLAPRVSSRESRLRILADLRERLDTESGLSEESRELMLQRNLTGCIVVLIVTAISSAQSTVSSGPTPVNSQNPNTQASARIAPASIPQQQPAWRQAPQVQTKPSPQVAQSQAPHSSVEPTAGASIAWPGASNQPTVTVPKITNSQPQQPAVEPTTGASISWPGGPNRARINTPIQPAIANSAIDRPASLPLNSAPAMNNGMPVPQPLAGSLGRAGVDYRAGQLSVVAENAELGKLMRLIGNKTGAQIDVAADIANELVMAHLGPASPNEVLTALLDSSHLTYIMIGEEKVSKVVIRRRYGSVAPPVVARHRNLGFPEPAAEDQNPSPVTQEQLAESGELRPTGELAPPASSSRTMPRAGSPLLPGQNQAQDANNQQPIENVDVRSQVSGTEAPDQPESNPPPR